MVVVPQTMDAVMTRDFSNEGSSKLRKLVTKSY